MDVEKEKMSHNVNTQVRYHYLKIVLKYSNKELMKWDINCGVIVL